MSYAFRFVIQSNVGVVRNANEDCAIASTKLIAVADGMGGHAAGEVASSTVIDTFSKNLDSLPSENSEFQNWMLGTTNQAHAAIGDLIAADNEKRGMGTTFSAIAVVDNQIGVGHIGDSRIYQFRQGALKQISIDHTYVQSLVDNGEITASEAAVHPRRNLLIRAIDGIHEVSMDIQMIDIQVGDRYLLCSDGLTGVVSDRVIAEQLSKTDLTAAVSQLIEFALAAGAPDNVTVAACEVIDEDELLNSGVAPIIVGAYESAQQITPTEKPSRKLLVVKVAAAVAIALAGLVVANNWLNSQWYVGVNNGNVAIYQGINQQLGPIAFNRLSTRSELPLEALTANDLATIEHGLTIDNLSSGLNLVQQMWSRSSICESAVVGCTP